ncbi:MAG: aminotransferase class I/II-fold pyridoxal phosphate-dependent enzyme [Cyclobacteriaceae bacterium]
MVDQLTSNRLNGIGEYYFSQKLREIDGLNRKGHNVLNLGIGSPDLEPPEAVKKALVASLDDPQFHRYQSYKGIPELREAFSSWYEKFYNVTLNPDSEVLPLIGSKEGIMHICMAFLNEGDEVLIPNPGYPTYASAAKLAGGTPRFYELNEAGSYLPDLSELASSDLSRVKLMWVNYPHMPTGTSASTEIFKDLREFCCEHKIILINDNPYSFTMTEKPSSILEGRKEEELLLELNSLSKSHNMSGWRIGTLSGNADLVSKVLIFKSNMDSGMFKPVMQATIEALSLEQSWYDSINEKYQERKNLVLEIADQLGCQYKKDQVGMFVWARIPNNEISGELFADRLLNEYRFFVPPGMIFGSAGDQYIRFSLCSHPKILKEVLDRIN